jgi:hypothetical protein
MSNQGSTANRPPALRLRGAKVTPQLHAYITSAVSTLVRTDMTDMTKLYSS